MANHQMSAQEIAGLITKYKSDLRTLEFQVEQARSTIDALEDTLSEGGFRLETSIPGAVQLVQESGSTTTTKRKSRKKRPGRPARSSSKRRPGRPRKKGKRGPGRSSKSKTSSSSSTSTRRRYRLNEWDEMIIGELEKSDQALDTNHFIEKAQKVNKKDKKGLDNDQVRARISASLNKLVNRHDRLQKVKKKGRGSNYRLK